jgi:teichuronic acid exporter
MSLKQKAISGLTWSFIDSFFGQGIQFVVGIILARILSPREFGLIGMISVFIAVSQTFINSGFGSALIRKKECTQVDYSTVFFFNLITGIFFFGLLFLLAPSISHFFDEPELKQIIQVLGIVLIIDSLTLIQQTILTKKIDFKLQARISIVASIGSGLLAIAMAYSGFGVWSLVGLRLTRQTLNSLFFWMWNCWKPSLIFSMAALKELFGFGSKLLASGLLDTLYTNIYYFIIGKYFSATELGFYSRADQFQKLPSQNLNLIIGRVSFPVLSTLQDDLQRLKNNYTILIRSVMFITFILMFGMAAVAKPMILTLIGEKWLPSVIYLQLLCFVGVFYPLHALNLNILKVMGRSDLFLRLEIIKKILVIPVIIIGIIYGIKPMIYSMMIYAVLAYFLNSFWSGKLINYHVSDQIKDLFPSLFFAFIINILVYALGRIINMSDPLKLLTQITFGAILTISIGELLKFRDYIFMKEIVFDQLKILRTKNNGKTR